MDQLRRNHYKGANFGFFQGGTYTLENTNHRMLFIIHLKIRLYSEGAY